MVSIYIALYLFLAGTGAGAFLIGAVVDMVLRFRPRAAGGWFERVSAVTDAGLILGPVLVAVSALFLFLDLGVPDRVFHLFLASTSSLLSMGAWAILVFCVMATLALILGSLADGEGDGYEYELAPGKVVLRVCEFACSFVAMGMALFVVVYSGIFLAMYPSLPFLHTGWVPVLFVASALACGLAALIVTAFFRLTSPGMQLATNALLPLDMVFVVVEALVLAGFLASCFASDGPAGTSAQSLMSGNIAPLFWAGVVMMGLVAPFSVDAVCRRLPAPVAVVLGSACALVGGLCLRVALLMATERFNLVFMSALGFWN